MPVPSLKTGISPLEKFSEVGAEPREFLIRNIYGEDSEVVNIFFLAAISHYFINPLSEFLEQVFYFPETIASAYLQYIKVQPRIFRSPLTKNAKIGIDLRCLQDLIIETYYVRHMCNPKVVIMI